MQGGHQNQHEADAREDAMADRQALPNVVANDLSARTTGYTSACDEGHRERFRPHMRNDHNQPTPEKPSVFWKRVYVAVILNTIVVVTLLWAFSRYFSS
jgi:hypothetical protein